jgi:membrane protease YdiL (CAAX protease family)
MTTGLSTLQKAAVFSALVVVLALGAAGAIQIFDLPNGLRSSALYMMVPAATVLLMLLVVTRDGYIRAGWASLGLHRLGLRSWGVAIIAPVVVSLVGTAIVWATPLASFVAPSDSLSTVVGFVQLVLFTLTLSLGEELGWRGYLLPRLLPLGRTPALLVTGLVWAAWHLPLIYLTPLYHADGNRWIVVPLFVVTIVAGSFVFGYLRLWTDSVWPAALAHSAHNGAWGTLAAFSVTTSPVVVDEYLVGDNGILILIGTAMVAWWLGRRLMATRELNPYGRPKSVTSHTLP